MSLTVARADAPPAILSSEDTCLQAAFEPMH